MKKWQKVSLGVFLILLIFSSIVLKIFLDWKEYNKYPDRGIARIDLILNEVSLEEIKNGDKETKYEGNELIVYDDGKIVKFKDVEIKGRGNSTWLQEKKPYQIKLDRSDYLFGLNKTKKWIFLANALDYSYVRNHAALILAEILEIKYNQAGEFVELYINGEYEGLYYAVRKNEISKGSVDLRAIGSVLFEIDNLHWGENKYYESELGDKLIARDVVALDDKERERIIEDFLADYREFEKEVKRRDYEKIKSIIDVESFAKYYLISEFTVNPDAYTSSLNLYREDRDGKISVGPVWDFDFAFGNKEWWWGVDDSFYSPEKTMARKREAFGEDNIEENKNISKLFYHLMEIPEFKNEVKRIFNEKMSGRKTEFIKLVSDSINEIKSAAAIDSQKWEIDKWLKETEELLKWIDLRYQYFEVEYGE